MTDSPKGHQGGNEKLKQVAAWVLGGILVLAFLESQGGVGGLLQRTIRGAPIQQPYASAPFQQRYAGSVPVPMSRVGVIPQAPAVPEIPSHYVGDPIPPQWVRTEHPPANDPNAYRCDIATRRPANPGNGYCPGR